MQWIHINNKYCGPFRQFAKESKLVLGPIVSSEQFVHSKVFSITIFCQQWLELKLKLSS